MFLDDRIWIQTMPVRDMALAVLTSVIWGLAFGATTLGLESFSAPQLTALRFLIAALPVFFVPRPQIELHHLILIGLFLFAGQFLLLFFAYKSGMLPGLASVTQQMQAFFTIILSAIFLRDIPTWRQGAGALVAFSGLVVIGLTVGGSVSLIALCLAQGGALSWAIGNVLVKRAKGTSVFPLMVWASLVPPIPALLLSASLDGGPSFLSTIAQASWTSIGAAIYLGGVATMAYGIWGSLLRRYPSGLVAPFALVAPCTGVISSAVFFGEVFSPQRYAGIMLILVGLAVIVLPGRWFESLIPKRHLR
jgi:O-acetylserine/cysteine efflux transporter